MKKCCFAGHSKIDIDENILRNKIKEKTIELITQNDVTEFWCGNYGAFDRISASVISE